MMKPTEQMTDGGRQAGGGAQWRPEEREDGRVNFMSLSLGCGARLKQWAEDPNRRFSREDIQVADKHLKRCSALLTVRKIQIETTVRYHLLPMRMAAAKAHASDTHACTHTHRKGGLPRTWSGETPVHCWWDCKMVQLLWKNTAFLPKIEVPYHPAILFLSVLPKELKADTRTGICTRTFTAASSTTAKE